MDNGKNWSWNDGDERRISSVYSDEDETNAFILVNPPQNIEPQNTNAHITESSHPEPPPHAAEPQPMQPQPIEPQPPIGQPYAVEPQTINHPQPAVPPNGTPHETKPQSDISQPQPAAPQIRQAQEIETQPVNAQNSARQPKMPNEPQSNVVQPEFHPIVLPQNTRQNNYNKTQNTNHSAQFHPKDISDNKVSAIAAYLLGPIGIIIALLIARDSPYTAFHVRQALKITICSVILELFAGIFALCGMIPLVGIIFRIMLIIVCAAWIGVLILRLAAIAQVSGGEAREPAIIRNFEFLK